MSLDLTVIFQMQPYTTYGIYLIIVIGLNCQVERMYKIIGIKWIN